MVTFKIYNMPGDGNCLFHSLGKAFKKSHIEMRNTIIGFIERKPKYKISDARIKDWIKWENNLSWRKYVSYMLNQGTWGGALEIQLCSEIFNTNIVVLERGKNDGKFNIISKFLRNKGRIVFLVYEGRCHYNYCEVITE